jgi:hypothetical protein
VDGDLVSPRRGGEVYPNSCSLFLVSPGTRDGASARSVDLEPVGVRQDGKLPARGVDAFSTARWGQLRLVP